MIKFSKREDYAIILVNTLATHYGKRLVPLSEVAKTYNISILFLRNLANELRQHNLIQAVEGKKGGYFLETNPNKLKVGDILKIFSNKPILQCCSLANSKANCPKEKICEPGHIWRQLNKDFLNKIYNLTLSEFIQYKQT